MQAHYFVRMQCHQGVGPTLIVNELHFGRAGSQGLDNRPDLAADESVLW